MKNEIITALKKLYNYFVKQYKIDVQKRQYAVISQAAAFNSGAIRYDLFEGFRHSNYPNIHPVVTFNNIRSCGWCIQNNTVIYRYTLSKTNAEPLASPILKSIMSNMNTDLAGALTTLVHMYGYDYVSSYYPYLYNGLYIVSIRDLGIDIELTVVTNFLT